MASSYFSSTSSVTRDALASLCSKRFCTTRRSFRVSTESARLCNVLWISSSALLQRPSRHSYTFWSLNSCGSLSRILLSLVMILLRVPLQADRLLRIRLEKYKTPLASWKFLKNKRTRLSFRLPSIGYVPLSTFFHSSEHKTRDVERSTRSRLR